MRIDAISVNPDRAGKYRLQLSDGSVMKLYRQTIADFGLYAGMEMTEEERAWLLVKMVCIEDLRVQKVLSEALWV